MAFKIQTRGVQLLKISLKEKHRTCFTKMVVSYFLSRIDTESINFDHHLRCGGWLNFEFSKRGKTFGMDVYDMCYNLPVTIEVCTDFLAKLSSEPH